MATLLDGTCAETAAAPLPPGMQLEPLPLKVPEPADNPSTPEKIALGRLLFFDPILSANRDVSCATCHDPKYGWGDGRSTPIGVGGTGIGPGRTFVAGATFSPLTRNTPSLLNVGFNGVVAGTSDDPALAPMFWDARVQGLERQVLVPMRSREEMRGEACAEQDAIPMAIARIAVIPGYRDRFAKAFNATTTNSAVNAVNLARAIAAFERSLVTAPTSYDRFLRGDKSALTAEQQRGFKVFQEAGCVQCHGGPMLSDFKLHFIGVQDDTPDGRREFRTPSLRNLRHTGPYMHNGSQRTVRDILIFYEALSDAVSETLDGGDTATQPRLDPLLRHLNLSTEDIPALEAFLDSLSTDQYDRSVPDKGR